MTKAQRLRPRLTYAVPHLAVQSRLELIRTMLGLTDGSGARTVHHTVKTQAISIYRKLGVSSRSDAMRVASGVGLLSY